MVMPLQSAPIQASQLKAHTPLHGSQPSRDLESLAKGTVAPHILMERAGLSVARLALAIAPMARRVAVAVGPGNNGGDGLVAARHLYAAGWAVDVVMARAPETMPSDARDAFARLAAHGLRPTLARREAPGNGAQHGVDTRWHDDPPDLLIDAMLGIGAARPPESEFSSLWQSVLRCPAPRLAADLPSGLDPDRGLPLFGLQVPRAKHTLNLLTLKPGVWTGEGRELAGEIWLDRLGVPEDLMPPTAQLWPRLGVEGARFPKRSRVSHKGSHGDAIVVGGSDGMLGALVLASKAAMAVGAGRVWAVPLTTLSAEAQLAAAEPAVMWRSTGLLAQAELARHAVVVAGCGGGDAIRSWLPTLLSRAARLVLDADALNAVASDEGLKRLLKQRSDRGHKTVLTPHPLEAARLLGRESAREVQADRLAAAHALAHATQAVVVLKGAGTVVVAPGGTPWVHAAGNGLLATAGTGDVLAGSIGGIWAAAGLGNEGKDATTSACMAVWQHGAAADHAAAHGLTSLTASSLPDRMAKLSTA